MLALLLTACALFDPPPPEIVVVVVKGDTLGEIAREHGVTVADLKAWNGLSSDLIEIGQRLVIRTDGDAPPVVASLERATKKSRGAVTGGTGEGRPRLTLPAAKKCLGGPSVDDLDDERGAIASSGLGEADVRASMNAFLPNVSPCLRMLGSHPSGALTLAITVGCDGLVDRVAIEGHDDWPSDAAACIADTLAYAPFPAHDLPDGDTFVYPLRMQ